MNVRALWLLPLAALLSAGTTVPVSLKVDDAAQVAAEREFKALIDQWSEPGLDITFKARPTSSLDRPLTVRVYLDQVKCAANPAWYARFRAFHAKLIKQPFAAEVVRHAAAYCAGGSVFMRAACQDGGGRVLYQADAHNFLSMSRAQDTQLYFFALRDHAPMPAKPPSLAYLAHGSVGDPIYVDVPKQVAASIAKIHIEDRPAVRWPSVAVAAPKPAATSRPVAAPASAAGAPILPRPSL